MSEKIAAALAAQLYGLVALGGTLAVCLHYDRGVLFALLAIFFGYLCQVSAAMTWMGFTRLENIGMYSWGLSVCFVLMAVFLVWWS